MRSAGLLLAAFLTCGCAHFPVDAPLDQVDPKTGYRFQHLELGPGNTDETFVILSLSGGGTRAAALDYGALTHLAALEIGDGRSLLDEVDVVTSSSAASLVTGYWLAFGREQTLERFDDDVLSLPIQSAALRRVANPLRWPRLWSRTFSRSDLLVEYLDEEVFRGATFGTAPTERPMLLMNATDISSGAQFTFGQGLLDVLCVDLDESSIARAVTASMAFSGGLTPITYRNFPHEDCGYERPSWADEILDAGFDANPREYDQARLLASWEDVDRAWLHLVDGGVSDNIGVRAAFVAFAIRGTPWSVVDRIEAGEIKRLVVILVDARRGPDYPADARARPPGLVSVVSSSASRPLANFSSETVELVRDGLAAMNETRSTYDATRQRCRELAETTCPPGDDACHGGAIAICRETFGVRDEDRPSVPETYFVHARFAALDDTELRNRLLSLPTSLELPAEDVQLLIDSAPAVLEATGELQRLVEDLRAEE